MVKVVIFMNSLSAGLEASKPDRVTQHADRPQWYFGQHYGASPCVLNENLSVQ